MNTKQTSKITLKEWIVKIIGASAGLYALIVILNIMLSAIIYFQYEKSEVAFYLKLAVLFLCAIKIPKIAYDAIVKILNNLLKFFNK